MEMHNTQMEISEFSMARLIYHLVASKAGDYSIKSVISYLKPHVHLDGLHFASLSRYSIRKTSTFPAQRLYEIRDDKTPITVANNEISTTMVS